jgi:uncharacterized protein
MAHFVIHALDKPGSLALRQATRPAHLAYLEGFAQHMVAAGALLDAAGEAPIGSLLVVDMADRAAVDALVAGDPYTQAGLFASVTISPWRKVYPQ